jgi:hypothetical protein
LDFYFVLFKAFSSFFEGVERCRPAVMDKDRNLQNFLYMWLIRQMYDCVGSDPFLVLTSAQARAELDRLYGQLNHEKALSKRRQILRKIAKLLGELDALTHKKIKLTG